MQLLLHPTSPPISIFQFLKASLNQRLVELQAIQEQIHQILSHSGISNAQYRPYSLPYPGSGFGVGSPRPLGPDPTGPSMLPGGFKACPRPLGHGPTGSTMVPVPKDHSIAVGNTTIKPVESRNDGALAHTFHGKLKGWDVIVKRYPVDTRKTNMDLLRQELNSLRSLRSEYLFPIFSAAPALDNEDVYLIVTPVINLSLSQWILHPDSKRTPWITRVGWAMTIAYGMQYLHHNNVVHRSLSSQNIAIDHFWKLRVSNFGLTRIGEIIVPPYNNSMLVENSPLPYLAPEIIDDKINSGENKETDIYAFSIIMWEILAFRIPYSDIPYDADSISRSKLIHDIVNHSLRPPIEPSFSQSYHFLQYIDLIRKCWAPKSTDRPSFDLIVGSLGNIARSLSSHPIEFFNR
ncbi:uncharacterized protein VTP21DRAFT_6148 [Calcarisporiella thermophila]|uniref:uncharacterized protein n=1 Tax=Calcarisporiella thermophila TaxID=911321 RepID=UPI0037443E20